MMISVIIPCYNSGKFLMEALESTKSFKVPFEVIVVNDGSTEEETLQLLNELKNNGVHIIHQENGGPGKARNTGVSSASGKYILPLDADNMINTEVFEKALSILENDTGISVVYTDIEMIGEKTGLWKVGSLDEEKILIRNQIDTCTLIRKSAFVEIGGYDESRELISHEDWDLWIRMYQAGKKFHYLQEVGFKYRVRSSSLLRETGITNHEAIRSYFVKKYSYAYYELLLEWEKEIDKGKLLKRTLKNRFKTIIKILLDKPLY